jgi:hypothetical protein
LVLLPAFFMQSMNMPEWEYGCNNNFYTGNRRMQAGMMNSRGME